MGGHELMTGGAGGMLGDALLVALGAVPGAWLRFLLVNRLEPVLPHRHWGTLVVNLAACFGLGLLSALRAHGQAPAAFLLLLGTGFLGSLSTFSTLAAEHRSSGAKVCALPLARASRPPNTDPAARRTPSRR